MVGGIVDCLTIPHGGHLRCCSSDPASPAAVPAKPTPTNRLFASNANLIVRLAGSLLQAAVGRRNEPFA
jgi:hypothetical protein